jgi:hypothetical protein
MSKLNVVLESGNEEDMDKSSFVSTHHSFYRERPPSQSFPT